MSLRKLSTEQMVHLGWRDWESDIAGNWSFDQMQTAAMMHTAKMMDRAASRLQSIIDRLDTLGREGIHEVVKEMAREARVKKKRRLARRRAARKLKVAA